MQTLNNALLENNCSEQASRMSAMESSTKNAKEMLDKLTLSYNRCPAVLCKRCCTGEVQSFHKNVLWWFALSICICLLQDAPSRYYYRAYRDYFRSSCPGVLITQSPSIFFADTSVAV